MFLCISECVYVGNTKVKKRHTKEMPKRSTCNEWSQLEADTTGKPPSVRVAVVLIESFVLNIRNTIEPASSSGTLGFSHGGGERETRVTRE